jgi:RNA polymerase sigma-70 factor (ECF subfamily)
VNEHQLISAAQRGDVLSFNQLVRAHQGLVYRTAFRVVGNADAAADATQDAFISAFKNLRSFRGGSFKTWLLRIVANACYDQLRAKRRKPTTSLDAMLTDPDGPALKWAEVQAESPQEFAERRELGSLIQKGLETLPPEQRMTVVLSDIEGFSYKEIADIIDTNIGTVKSRLNRGRAQLCEFLIANAEVGRTARVFPTCRPSPARGF